MSRRLSPSERQAIPAIGPGASKRPRGRYLAEQGRARRAAPTWRKTWCPKDGCPGHVVVADGVASGDGRCA